MCKHYTELEQFGYQQEWVQWQYLEMIILESIVVQIQQLIHWLFLSGSI